MLSLLYSQADRLRHRERRRASDPDLVAGRREEDLPQPVSAAAGAHGGGPQLPAALGGGRAKSI